MEKVETDFNKQNEKWNREYHVWFTIKADRTDANEAVHEGFKEFCKLETDNNFTQGLRKLLEFYQEDGKYMLIAEKIQMLEYRLAQLEQGEYSHAKEVEEGKGLF